MKRQFPEKEVKSFRTLVKILETIDMDEGIRLFGKINDYEDIGFIFINKISSNYCINTVERKYQKKTGSYIPKGQGSFLYYTDINDVLAFIENNAMKPIRAWVY